MKRFLKKHFPGLVYQLFTKPTVIANHKTERLLADGKDLSTYPKKSVIFFTAHRSGSTFLNNTLKKISADEGFMPVDYDFLFTVMGQDYFINKFKDSEFLQKGFKSTGYYYGAFRSYRNIPNLEKYKIVLLLRDPRDVLNSLYFSTTFSHDVLNTKLIENKKRAIEIGIDKFVLQEAPEYLQTYRDYIEKLLPLSNVRFVRYEDLIENFPGILNELIDNIDLSPRKDLVDSIIEASTFKTKKENKYSQRRSGRPGDYLEKLHPETIEKLNVLFEKELKALGYKTK